MSPLAIRSTGPRTDIRELNRTLANAEDARLVEVVSLVDGMTERGMADALIAPLRSRLMVLRPARKLSLNRMIFMPADPVIVPAPQWRRDTLTVPRTAISCLATQIRTALGDATVSINAELAGATSADHQTMLRCGQMLWPLAANILDTAPMPPDWPESTGLNAADHAGIVRPLSVLLRQGGAVEAMALQHEAGTTVLAAPLRDCLIDAINQSARHEWATRAMGMVMAVLLARVGQSELLIMLVSDLAASMDSQAARLASDMAIDLLLDRAGEPFTSTLELCDATEALARLATLFDALERPGPSQRPTSKARVAQLRRELDTSCRVRFEAEMTGFVEAMTANAAAREADDAVALEQQALALRTFELTSRSFGGTAHYERMLGLLSRELAEVKPAGRTAVMDHARLLEILHGPEAGLAFLRLETH